MEKTKAWLKTIPVLVCLDRKKLQITFDTYDNKKRKRKEKEDKDDAIEIKKPKKEKKSSEEKTEKTEGPASILNRLKDIVEYEKKIEAIVSLKEEEFKKCCITKHGSGKLFVSWLSDEADYIENDANDYRGIRLIKHLVHIIDPTLEKDKAKIKWTADLVKETRIDKIIRRIYKSFQTKIANDDDNNEKEVLSDMIEILKPIWTKFREIFSQK